MNEQYFILENGEQRGPFAFDELTEMELDIHTRVLSPFAETWQDACDLPEFYAYFEAQGVIFPTEDNLASFGWRFLAFMIDYVIIAIFMGFIMAILISNGVIKVPSLDPSKWSYSNLLIMQIVVYVTLIAYNSIGEASSMKGSVGKKICKLVVVDADGMKQTYLNALLRSAGKVVSLFFYGIGFISILFTENKQAMHDFLAKTYVVKL